MIAFLLTLTICWGFFALLYTLLLRQETFFRANRAYLLGTAALGILLALPIDWLTVWHDETAAPAVVLPAITVGLQQAEATIQTWHWLDYLWVVYYFGAGVALMRMLWGLFKIMRMAARGDKERLPDGCVVVKTTEAKTPFSFFKWVFVPKIEVAAPDGEKVFAPKTDALMLAHERAHAHDWHSVDVLLVEMLCVVFWFHPLAHWYRRSLRTVHEYLADAEASRRTDKKQYGLLLIRQAQSGVSLAFVNHFFQSPLKQRLIMLTQNASPALRAWKYGLALPVLAILFLFACQKTATEQADQTTTEQSTSDRATAEKDVFELFDVKQPPQFPGGQAALGKFLSENIQYPEAAKSESAEGMVAILFVVDENGKVTEAEGVKTEQHGWRQDFQDEAIRVVKSMPNWEPAIKNGKPVKVKFTLPIKFKLK